MPWHVNERPGPVVTDPQSAVDLWPWLREERSREVAAMAVVDPGLRVLANGVISVGNTSATFMDPTIILSTALRTLGAAGFFVGHSHPSGDVTPSLQDEQVWKRLDTAAATVDLVAHDSLVVGAGTNDWWSIRSTAARVDARLAATAANPEQLGERFEAMTEPTWGLDVMALDLRHRPIATHRLLAADTGDTTTAAPMIAGEWLRPVLRQEGAASVAMAVTGGSRELASTFVELWPQMEASAEAVGLQLLDVMIRAEPHSRWVSTRRIAAPTPPTPQPPPLASSGLRQTLNMSEPRMMR